MRPSALAALSFVALTSCGGTRAAGPASPTPDRAPASVAATTEPIYIETKSTADRYYTIVQRITDSRTKAPRIAYELRATSSQAVVAGASSTVTFERPHVTFHDRQGKKLIADSPQAKITQRDKGVIMTGGVRARADDGSVLTCDSLRYDGRTEKLHGEGHVVLVGPNDFTLNGDDLDGDIRLDNVRVSRRPR